MAAEALTFSRKCSNVSFMHLVPGDENRIRWSIQVEKVPHVNGSLKSFLCSPDLGPKGFDLNYEMCKKGGLGTTGLNTRKEKPPNFSRVERGFEERRTSYGSRSGVQLASTCFESAAYMYNSWGPEHQGLAAH